MERLRQRAFLPVILLIFTASGFAGLIYESIWTRYLGLFVAQHLSDADGSSSGPRFFFRLQRTF